MSVVDAAIMDNLMAWDAIAEAMADRLEDVWKGARTVSELDTYNKSAIEMLGKLITAKQNESSASFDRMAISTPYIPEVEKLQTLLDGLNNLANASQQEIENLMLGFNDLAKHFLTGVHVMMVDHPDWARS